MSWLKDFSVSDLENLPLIVLFVGWIVKSLVQEYFFDFIKHHLNRMPPVIKNYIEERNRQRQAQFQAEVYILLEDDVLLRHYHNKLIWAQTELIIYTLMIILFGGLAILLNNLFVSLVAFFIVAVSINRFSNLQGLAYYLRDVINEAQHLHLKEIDSDLAARVKRHFQRGLSKQDQIDPPNDFNTDAKNL